MTGVTYNCYCNPDEKGNRDDVGRGAADGKYLLSGGCLPIVDSRGLHGVAVGGTTRQVPAAHV